MMTKYQTCFFPFFLVDVHRRVQWTYFSYMLSRNQDMAQMMVTNLSQSIIESGISTEQGIYGVLKDGKFLMNHSFKKFDLKESIKNLAGEEEEELKTSVQLHLLASIWEHQVSEPVLILMRCTHMRNFFS